MRKLSLSNDYIAEPFQDIEFVTSIEINNTAEILKELDNLGINRATLYGDYDNYAEYIKEKHLSDFKDKNENRMYLEKEMAKTQEEYLSQDKD